MYVFNPNISKSEFCDITFFRYKYLSYNIKYLKCDSKFKDKYYPYITNDVFQYV